MSEKPLKNVQARIESILSKCDDIEFIIDRHGSITNALNDREGQPALLMLIEAIAEQFHKIENKNNEKEILKKFGTYTIKGIYATRNFIAHDYDGIDLAFVESGLREINSIKQVCLELIKSYNLGS